MPELEIRKVFFEPNTSRLEIKKVNFQAGAWSQLEIRRVQFSVIPYRITASDANPDSRELVTLSFSGDPNVLTVWRVISVSDPSVDSQSILTSSNLNAFMTMPICTQETIVKIGARQGSGSEVTTDLKVKPTPHRLHTSSLNVVPGVMWWGDGQ